MTPSPWQTALGDDFRQLDPRLTTYFGRIPEGSVGRGEGIFDRVGTPKRWLWPALAILGRAGIVFPVWESDVPFSVINLMHGDELRAERVFRFARGVRTMSDAVSTDDAELVDRLGRHRRLEVRFAVSVDAGSLVLRSTSVAIRIGSRWISVPRFVAPSTMLRETAGERQYVAFTMSAPLIGRIYEYSGHFDYAVASA